MKIKSVILLPPYPKEKDSRYPKIKSWVRKDYFVVIRAEYYNAKDEIEKAFEVKKLEMIDCIWTSLEFSMENHKMKHRTLSTVKNVEYNKSIPEQRFEMRLFQQPYDFS